MTIILIKLSEDITQEELSVFQKSLSNFWKENKHCFSDYEALHSNSKEAEHYLITGVITTFNKNMENTSNDN